MNRLDQRGRMIEVPIIFALGLIFFAIAVPDLKNGHWVKGGLFALLGVGCWGLLLFTFARGWWENRKDNK